MPCNAAPYPEYSRHDLDAVELYMQTQLDRVTRVACEVIHVLRINALFNELGDESKAWSLEHDAWDLARELIESSVKVQVRKPHFDKDGHALFHGPCDDDIDELRSCYLGDNTTADVELSRAVYENIIKEDVTDIEEEFQGD